MPGRGRGGAPGWPGKGGIGGIPRPPGGGIMPCGRPPGGMGIPKGGGGTPGEIYVSLVYFELVLRGHVYRTDRVTNRLGTGMVVGDERLGFVRA